MKKIAVLSAILILAPLTSFAGGLVICGNGQTSADAIRELNKSLSSQSGTFFSETDDGDNKDVAIAIKDVTSVSGVTVIENYYGLPFGACVTVFGPSKKVKN